MRRGHGRRFHMLKGRSSRSDGGLRVGLTRSQVSECLLDGVTAVDFPYWQQRRQDDDNQCCRDPEAPAAAPAKHLAHSDQTTLWSGRHRRAPMHRYRPLSGAGVLSLRRRSGSVAPAAALVVGLVQAEAGGFGRERRRDVSNFVKRAALDTQSPDR